MRLAVHYWPACSVAVVCWCLNYLPPCAVAGTSTTTGRRSTSWLITTSALVSMNSILVSSLFFLYYLGDFVFFLHLIDATVIANSFVPVLDDNFQRVSNEASSIILFVCI